MPVSVSSSSVSSLLKSRSHNRTFTRAHMHTQTHTRIQFYNCVRVCVSIFWFESAVCFWPLCFISSFCTTLTSFKCYSSLTSLFRTRAAALSSSTNSGNSAALLAHLFIVVVAVGTVIVALLFLLPLVCTPATTKTGFSSYLWLFSTIHFLPAAFSVSVSFLHAHTCMSLCMCVCVCSL